MDLATDRPGHREPSDRARRASPPAVDPARRADALVASLAADPFDAAAAAELDALLREQRAFGRLAGVYEYRLRALENEPAPGEAGAAATPCDGAPATYADRPPADASPSASSPADPGTLRLALLMGLAALLEGELADCGAALVRYRQAQALSPHSRATLAGVRRCLAAAGQRDAALQVAAAEARLDMPDDERAALRAAVGRLHAERGAVGAARDSYEAALLLAPSCDAALAGLAELARERGAWAEAAALHDRRLAVLRGGDRAPILESLAALLAEAREIGSAGAARGPAAVPAGLERIVLAELVELRPETTAALARLSELERERGDFAASDALEERLLTQLACPRERAARAERAAETWLAAGEPLRALAWVDRADTGGTPSRALLLLRERIYRETAQEARLRETLESLEGLGPPSVERALEIAALHQRAGAPDRAVAVLSDARARGESQRTVLEALDRALQAAGMVEARCALLRDRARCATPLEAAVLHTERGRLLEDAPLRREAERGGAAREGDSEAAREPSVVPLWPPAVDAYLDALAAVPDHGPALARLRQIQRATADMGALRARLRHLAGAWADAPSARATLLCEAARAALEHGDTEEALATYREAASADAACLVAIGGLREVHARTGDPAVLAEACERELATAPERARRGALAAERVHALEQSGDVRRALAATRDWMRHAPCVDGLRCQVRLARAAHDRAQEEAALALLADAAESAAERATCLERLGDLALERAEPEALAIAARAFARAVRLAPCGSAHRKQLDLLRRTGRLEALAKALAAWRDGDGPEAEALLVERVDVLARLRDQSGLRTAVAALADADVPASVLARARAALDPVADADLAIALLRRELAATAEPAEVRARAAQLARLLLDAAGDAPGAAEVLSGLADPARREEVEQLYERALAAAGDASEEGAWMARRASHAAAAHRPLLLVRAARQAAARGARAEAVAALGEAARLHRQAAGAEGTSRAAEATGALSLVALARELDQPDLQADILAEWAIACDRPDERAVLDLERARVLHDRLGRTEAAVAVLEGLSAPLSGDQLRTLYLLARGTGAVAVQRRALEGLCAPPRAPVADPPRAGADQLERAFRPDGSPAWRPASGTGSAPGLGTRSATGSDERSALGDSPVAVRPGAPLATAAGTVPAVWRLELARLYTAGPCPKNPGRAERLLADLLLDPDVGAQAFDALADLLEQPGRGAELLVVWRGAAYAPTSAHAEPDDEGHDSRSTRDGPDPDDAHDSLVSLMSREASHVSARAWRHGATEGEPRGARAQAHAPAPWRTADNALRVARALRADGQREAAIAVLGGSLPADSARDGEACGASPEAHGAGVELLFELLVEAGDLTGAEALARASAARGADAWRWARRWLSVLEAAQAPPARRLAALDLVLSLRSDRDLQVRKLELLETLDDDVAGDARDAAARARDEREQAALLADLVAGEPATSASVLQRTLWVRQLAHLLAYRVCDESAALALVEREHARDPSLLRLGVELAARTGEAPREAALLQALVEQPVASTRDRLRLAALYAACGRAQDAGPLLWDAFQMSPRTPQVQGALEAWARAEGCSKTLLAVLEVRSTTARDGLAVAQLEEAVRVAGAAGDARAELRWMRRLLRAGGGSVALALRWRALEHEHGTHTGALEAIRAGRERAAAPDERATWATWEAEVHLALGDRARARTAYRDAVTSASPAPLSTLRGLEALLHDPPLAAARLACLADIARHPAATREVCAEARLARARLLAGDPRQRAAAAAELERWLGSLMPRDPGATCGAGAPPAAAEARRPRADEAPDAGALPADLQPGERDCVLELLALYAAGGHLERWRALAESLLGRPALLDTSQRRALTAELARRLEAELGDPSAAIAAWQRLLSPGDLVASEPRTGAAGGQDLERTARTLDPPAREALRALARLLDRPGHERSHLAVLEACARAGVCEPVTTWCDAARRWLQCGDTARALAAAGAALRLDPHGLAALRLRADLCAAGAPADGEIAALEALLAELAHRDARDGDRHAASSDTPGTHRDVAHDDARPPSATEADALARDAVDRAALWHRLAWRRAEAGRADAARDAALASLSLVPQSVSLRRDVRGLLEQIGAWRDVAALIAQDAAAASGAARAGALRQLARVRWEELGDARGACDALDALAAMGALVATDVARRARARAALLVAQDGLEAALDAAEAPITRRDGRARLPLPAIRARAETHRAAGEMARELELRLELGQRTDDAREASAALARAAQLCEDTADGLARAHKLYRAACERDPRAQAALAGVGRTAHRLGLWPEAERALARAASGLADRYGAALPHAAPDEDPVERTPPGGPGRTADVAAEPAAEDLSGRIAELFLLAATAALAMGAKPRAAAHLEEALAARPDAPEALGLLAEIARDLGAPLRARDCLVRLLDADAAADERYALACRLADACEAGGDRAGALRALECAIAEEPADDALRDRAIALLRELDVPERALAHLAETLPRATGARRAALRLVAAELAARLGRLEPARGWLLDVLAEPAGSGARFWVELAELCERVLVPDETLRAIELAPPAVRQGAARTELLWIGARALERAGRLREATAQAAAALELAPAHLEAARLLARHIGRSEDFARHVRCLEQALKVAELPAVAAAQLWEAVGQAYAGPLEDLVQAACAYRRAVAASPDRASAREALADLTSHDPRTRHESLGLHRTLLDAAPARARSWQALRRIARAQGALAAERTADAVLSALAARAEETHEEPPPVPRVIPDETRAAGPKASAEAPRLLVATHLGGGANVVAAHELLLALDEAGLLDRAQAIEAQLAGTSGGLPDPVRASLTRLSGPLWLQTDARLARAVREWLDTPSEAGRARIRALPRAARRRLQGAIRAARRASAGALDLAVWRKELIAQATACACATRALHPARAVRALVDVCEGAAHGSRSGGGDIAPAVEASPLGRALLLRFAGPTLDALEDDQ